MKLRMIGLSLALGLLLAGCGAEKTSTDQKFMDQVIQQSEELQTSVAEQDEDQASPMVSGDAVQPEQEAQQGDASEQEPTTDFGDETQPEQQMQAGTAEGSETGIASASPGEGSLPEISDLPDASDAPESTDTPDDTAEQPTASDFDPEHQLAVIYENRADWYTVDLEMGSYTVTDLDQNGKLEVVTSVCVGSGLFSTTDIWEVNGDALVKCERLMDEFESQADLVVSETVAYAVDGGWSYIFYDTVRMGVMGYNCDLRGVTLQNGAVSEQTYATLCETVDGDTSVLEAATADGAVLTEDEFYALKENLLPGEKRQVTFRWINVFDGEFDLNTASEADAIAMLGDLYAAFGLTEA